MPRLFYTILLVMFLTGAFSQVQKLDYSAHLSVPDGLSNSSVTCMLEGSQGHIWIGTFNGLNRYDGYDVKQYKNTYDKQLLASNRIRSLHEDKNGILWIGTEDGITIYDYKDESFRTIHSNKFDDKKANGPGVVSIIENPQTGNMYCLTEWDGLLLFDKQYKYQKTYFPPKNYFVDEMAFRNGILIDGTTLLFATTNNLVHFNLETETFSQIIDTKCERSSSIRKIDDRKLLLATYRGIVVLKIISSGKNFSYEIIYDGLKEYEFASAVSDSNGSLWLGASNKGVLHIDNLSALLSGQEVETSMYTPENEEYLVRNILCTKTKGCWVGTFDKGVYKFRSQKSPFHYSKDHPDPKLTIYPNRAINVTLIDSGRFSLVTKSGTAKIIDTETRKEEPNPIDFSQYASSNLVNVFLDSKGNTWAKYVDALVRIDASTKKHKVIHHEKLGQLQHFRNIKEDMFGNIWIHCLRKIYRLTVDENGELKNCEALQEHPFFETAELFFVRELYFDSQNDKLWIGTVHDGLCQMTLTPQVALSDVPIKQYVSDLNDSTSVSSNFVTAIKRAPNGQLWIGTEGGGICKVIEQDNKLSFVPYDERHGLSNNDVQNIQIDQNNNLWIVTNYGLNLFSPKEETFRKYYKEDGLPFEEFRPMSLSLSNGKLVFTGFNGYFYFDEKELAQEANYPSLMIEQLKVLNQTVQPHDTINGRVLLKKSLNQTQEIRLNYFENTLSLQLSSLHFSNPNNYYLKYKLLPHNQEWVKIPSNQRIVNFSGLRPDEYTLKVMASNFVDDWTKPRELKIVINPPWWNSVVMRFVYLFILVLIVYVVVKYRLELINLQHDLKIQQLEKDKTNEISAAKLRYFSNISHEIKTPITLISGPAKQLADRFKANSDVGDKLQLILRQSKRIIQLVNQVHDFQKSDADALKLNNSHFYFDELVKELKQDFGFMSREHHKVLEVKTDAKRNYVFADRDKLGKILNNLLSNSFKFTEENDSIIIDYHSEGNVLFVKVIDTGKGIAEADLPHIFERFYQSQQKHSANIGGAGIGLAFSKRLVEMHYGEISAESKLGEGTVVSLRLPIIKEEHIEEIEALEKEVLETDEAIEAKSESLSPKQEEKVISEGEFADIQVFLAEDNDDMRKFIASSLGKHFKVSSFANGKECLNELENQWPDIIVSDVLMPEMNGFDLCRSVKSDMKTSHIPVILLTACTTLDDKLQGLRQGADSYITKPFEMQLLVSQIEAVLQGRKQLRERFQLNVPLTRTKEEIEDGDATFLTKLYALMEQNLNNSEVDIDGFARELFLNRTHFYQKVKALTDQTPYSLLKEFRIKKAADLLVQKQLPINEVFLTTGFKSRPHFNRVFKEQFGVTPTEYVAKVKKEN